MSSAAALRLQIETSLATRIPGALTPRPRVTRETAATGIDELDTLLGGGLPIGAITELVGAHSSGRTTLALATMAEVTQADKTVAWVDASDALDPESAAAAGVELSRLLWVRCGQDAPTPGIDSGSGKAGITKSRSQGAAFLVERSRAAATGGGCGSPHPRGEARGLSEAVDAFLQPDVFSRAAPPRDPAVPRRNRMIGTPSAPNRKLDRIPQDARPLPRRARDREEQIPTDRQPSRRQTMYARQGEADQAKTLQAAQIAHTAAQARNRSQGGAWTDNASNAHGRSLATPPNAVAAGLPKFREMEARAAGQGHREPPVCSPWKPTFDERAFQKQEGSSECEVPIAGNDASRVTDPSAKASVRSSAKAVAGGPQQAQSALQGTLATKARHEYRASLAGDPPPRVQGTKAAVWRSLDQALRTTDLLLAAGGFSAVVLDLGNIAPEFAWRIPLATWFRFRAAADRARTVLLVLTQHPCARSSAELVLRCSPAEAQVADTVLTGARFHVAVDRQRFETPCADAPAAEPQAQTLHLVPRKQPQRERDAAWHRAAAWTGTEHRQPQGGHS